MEYWDTEKIKVTLHLCLQSQEQISLNVSPTVDIVDTGTVSPVTNMWQIDVNTHNMHESHLKATHVPMHLLHIYTRVCSVGITSLVSECVIVM